MTSPQEARHAAYRLMAAGTVGQYNEDLIAASEVATDLTGLSVNGSEIALLQVLPGAWPTVDDLNGLRVGYAAQFGFATWEAVNLLPAQAIGFENGGAVTRTFTQITTPYNGEAAYWGWINCQVGTGQGTVLTNSDETANERMLIQRQSDDKIHLIVVDGGVSQAELISASTVADGADLKIAFRIAAGDFAMSVNGAAVVTDAAGTLPTTDTLDIGQYFDDTSLWNGDIWTVALYNGTISNAILVSLATA